MKRHEQAEDAKKAMLIDAIVTGDKHRLQILTQPSKKVVVLDTFLDGLKLYSCPENSIGKTIIATENFKNMMDGFQLFNQALPGR